MEEKLKNELEQARIKNYILQKENEILLGMIGCLTKEKEELIKKSIIEKENKEEINKKYKENIILRIKRKLERQIRRTK